LARVPCDAEAWRVPSMSLCYIFRKSKGSDELWLQRVPSRPDRSNGNMRYPLCGGFPFRFPKQRSVRRRPSRFPRIVHGPSVTVCRVCVSVFASRCSQSCPPLASRPGWAARSGPVPSGPAAVELRHRHTRPTPHPVSYSSEYKPDAARTSVWRARP
jgi:hypothetical protein